jgi:hypothetical protein
LPSFTKSNVIYQFQCDCGSSYVGKTERNLSTRVKEHIPRWLVFNVNVLPKARKLSSSITKHLLSCSSPRYIHRRSGTAIGQQHTAAHRPFLQRVMFWSCITVCGPGPLIPISGTLNAEKYMVLLEQHLLPYCAVWYPNGDFLFQQDNAPCHKTKSVLQFLGSRGINTLDWPPYSPDLNCIENMWALLKSKVHKVHITSKQQLIQVATNIWENDDDIRDSCFTVIQSMPQRLHECIDSHGQYTHY